MRIKFSASRSDVAGSERAGRDAARTRYQPGQADPVWYELTRCVFTLLMRLYVIRFYVRGSRHIPADGPVMIFSNHQSKLDPFLLGWPLARPLAMPGKASLFRTPLVGALLRRVGGYPVERESADVSAMRTSIHVLRRGGLLAVFPEGGRSRTGEVKPFLPTLTRIAIRQRATIVPAGIAGSRDLLRPGSALLRPLAPLVVLYGEPFDLGAYYDRSLSEDDVTAATDFVRRAVLALVDEAEEIRRTRRLFEGWIV